MHMKRVRIFPSLPAPVRSALPVRHHDGPGVASLAQALVLPSQDNQPDQPLPEGCNVQLLPDGVFSANDGRPGNLPDCLCPAWRIDANAAECLIADAAQREIPLVVDYEHQTILAKSNGQPAPAAGFFSTLTYVPGQGLFTSVTWTPRARQHIADGEYLYISPVFTFCRETGTVTGLLHAALTNTPALDGMAAVAATSLLLPEQRITTDPEDHRMDDLLERLRKLLNLPEADEETLCAALDSLYSLLAEKTAEDTPVDLAAFVESVLSSALSTNEEDATVPLTALTGLQHEFAALTGQMAALRQTSQTQSTHTAITAALCDGRLPLSLEPWAKDLARTNPSVLEAFLERAKPIAALTTMQTSHLRQSHLPTEEVDRPKHSLTSEERYAAQQLGMTCAEYATYK